MQRLGAVTASGCRLGRRRHRRIRRPATEPAERPGRRAPREGGAAHPVRRRLRRTAARSARERRARQDVGSTRLQARPPVDRDRAAGRARRRPARARGGREARPRLVRVHVLDLRQRGHVALGRQRDRRSRTGLDDRPSLPVRHDAQRAVLARGSRGARATIRFTLSRAAKVRLQIETTTGVLVRALPLVTLQAGAQSACLGRPPAAWHARRTAARYVAHVFATSAVGTSDLATQFTFRRT